MFDLSVIIVSYNSIKDITNNLEYLQKLRKFIPFKVIIAENGDFGAWKSIRQYDFLHVHNSGSNVGFSKANNLAVAKCSASHLLFLNPDVIVQQDFITPMLSFMDAHPKTGACAPMLTYKDGNYQSSSGFKMGFFYEFLEAFMLVGIYRFFKSLKYKKAVHSDKPVKVGWVSGACMLVKKSVIETVGGFTEDYFLNYEDIDLCKRLEDKGYSNYYFPYLKCVHLDHKSFNEKYDLLVYTRYKSRLVYGIRHYGLLKRLLVRFMHILGLVIRLIFAFFVYTGIERKLRLKGYKDSLKLFLVFSK